MSGRDALRDVQDPVRNLRPRAARTLLPSDPPSEAAAASEQAQWLTVTLALGADAIVSATRFGRSDDSRVVVTQESKRRTVFDRQAELFDAKTLVRRFVQTTGATIAPYGAGDALKIATAIVRLSDLADDDDDRHETWEWAASFLEFAARNIHTYEAIYTPEGKWRTLSALRSWRPPADLVPNCEAAERAIVVADQATGDRIVRTSDVAAHVRQRTGKAISWSSLHGRMTEIGWEHLGEWEQRQPAGHRRLKAHVYRVPGDWERGEE